MNINYYRESNFTGEEESWQACQFTSETDLSSLTVKPLVTINGQHFLRQHHITYLTGKETCRAHHFAKFLATQVLSQQPSCPVFGDVIADQATAASQYCGRQPVKEGNTTTAATAASQYCGRQPVKPTAVKESPSACKVLWIDTLHGPHVCAQIYQELAAQAPSKSDLHFICLDVLGSQRDNVWAVTRNIEFLIKQLNPALIVIDDIDHLMPFCGITIANEFCRVVRDVTNHTDAAFLCIGYNHLGKRANTTGNLGKFLFMSATDVFSLSTQHEVTTVRLVNSYDMKCRPDDYEYRFTIGNDNLPHEVDSLPSRSAISDDLLREVVNDILAPGETITPDDFQRQVTTRQRQLRQQDRTDSLLAQALNLNLLKKVEGQKNNDGIERYTLNTSEIAPPLTTH